MLMSMVPEQFQKPSVEKTIKRGLNSHNAEYIRLAVLYSVTNSTAATWKKFKAYLGKTIDNNWHDGWQPEIDKSDKTPSLDFSKIPDKNLKFLADARNQRAIEELERRKLSMSDWT